LRGMSSILVLNNANLLCVELSTFGMGKNLFCRDLWGLHYAMCIGALYNVGSPTMVEETHNELLIL
jgi:hypothetical protein